MNALWRFVSLCMLGLAVYVGGWYLEGPLFQAVQMGAIALFLGAGFFALLSGGTRRIPLSLPELILGAAYVFAMLVAFARGSTMSVAFGAMFLVVLVSAAILVRQPEQARIDRVFRLAYMALLVSILAVQSGEYLTSVSGTVEYSVGLVRFTPLGMHPNLTGLVYAGGALLFAQQFLSAHRFHQKALAAVLAVLCLSMVFAASARASLFALGVTGAVAVLLIAWRGSRKARAVLVVGAIALVAVAVFKASTIADYLTVILDLDSPTRGTTSGATGREDLWRDGIALMFSDPLLFFTGRGVRAAGPEVIGFPVESSYINLGLEHGAVFGLLITLAFGVTAWRALARSFASGVMNPALLLSGLMLLFILFQSIFNRYLIAVGNPYSLWVLLLLLRLNLRLSPVASATTATASARSRAPRREPSFAHHAVTPP